MTKSEHDGMEIAFRCIVDSSEIDINIPGKMKFTYTDYEKLQQLIVEAIQRARTDEREGLSLLMRDREGAKYCAGLLRGAEINDTFDWRCDCYMVIGEAIRKEASREDPS